MKGSCKNDDDQDDLDAMRNKWSLEKMKFLRCFEVVDLPKLRGSLDERKGISPQLRGRAYYDSHNEFLEERMNESTTNEFAKKIIRKY